LRKDKALRMDLKNFIFVLLRFNLNTNCVSVNDISIYTYRRMRNLFLPKKFKGILGDALVCLSLLVLFASVISMGLDAEFSRVIKYDCEIAEISPDFTPAMKQECRKLRYEKQRYKT